MTQMCMDVDVCMVCGAYPCMCVCKYDFRGRMEKNGRRGHERATWAYIIYNKDYLLVGN